MNERKDGCRRETVMLRRGSFECMCALNAGVIGVEVRLYCVEARLCCDRGVNMVLRIKIRCYCAVARWVPIMPRQQTGG